MPCIFDKFMLIFLQKALEKTEAMLKERREKEEHLEQKCVCLFSSFCLLEVKLVLNGFQPVLRITVKALRITIISLRITIIY